MFFIVSYHISPEYKSGLASPSLHLLVGDAGFVWGRHLQSVYAHLLPDAYFLILRVGFHKRVKLDDFIM